MTPKSITLSDLQTLGTDRALATPAGREHDEEREAHTDTQRIIDEILETMQYECPSYFESLHDEGTVILPYITLDIHKARQDFAEDEFEDIDYQSQLKAIETLFNIVNPPVLSDLEHAHDYYAQEHTKYGMLHDHDDCISDIMRKFGADTAKEVNNQIAADIPELNITLIK